MTIIHIPIVRWVDNHNPGVVECLLTDAHGNVWSIIDKLPMFTESIDYDETTEYPQRGILACEIISARIDNHGRTICVISTERPWGVEAVDGTNRFTVMREQIKTP